MNNQYVSYIRVSTEKQGESGLGLEAQQSAINAYLKKIGPDAVLKKAFIEVKSGMDNNRPILNEMKMTAIKMKADILIAKSDRLSRSQSFFADIKNELAKYGIKIICVDKPNEDKKGRLINNFISEVERELISERTIAALKAWKERNPDKRLGNPMGSKAFGNAGNGAANAEKIERADEQAFMYKADIERYKHEGDISASAIARRLNADGYTTRKGNKWSPRTVIDMMNRIQ